MIPVALLAILGSSSLPRFAAKFVDLNRYDVFKNVALTDARRDLCLSGYTYLQQMDSSDRPLTIYKGHPRGMWPANQGGGETSFWVQAFLSGERVSAVLDRFPCYGDRAKTVTAVPYRSSWTVPAGSKPLPDARGRVPVEFRFSKGSEIPQWARSSIKAVSPTGLDRGVDVSSAATNKGYGLVNVTFYPVMKGYSGYMPDGDQSLPFVEAGQKHLPLGQCVVGKGRYGFQKILWVSPEGWFIVRATKNGHDGIAWLYPVGGGGKR